MDNISHIFWLLSEVTENKQKETILNNWIITLFSLLIPKEYLFAILQYWAKFKRTVLEELLYV